MFLNYPESLRSKSIRFTYKHLFQYFIDRENNVLYTHSVTSFVSASKGQAAGKETISGRKCLGALYLGHNVFDFDNEMLEVITWNGSFDW